jgi:sulfotransferase 6B1
MNSVLKSSIRQLAQFPVPLTLKELKATRNGRRVLVNSMPKAGTFVVRRLLDLLPEYFVCRWASHGLVTDSTQLPILEAHVKAKLSHLKQGQYISSHLPWHPDLVSMLKDFEIRSIFIIRDIRDVAVSLSHYIAFKDSQHRLYAHFRDLPSDSDRLMAVIHGTTGLVPGQIIGEESIGQQASNFMPWLSESDYLSIRFEDLIGNNGGGCAQKQVETIQKIVKYIEIPLSDSEISDLAHRVFFRKSTTFRNGQIGDWKNHFTEAHKDAFKEVAGDALIKLGYETDYDW